MINSQIIHQLVTYCNTKIIYIKIKIILYCIKKIIYLQKIKHLMFKTYFKY